MDRFKRDLDEARFSLRESEGSCDRGSPVGETENGRWVVCRSNAHTVMIVLA